MDLSTEIGQHPDDDGDQLKTDTTTSIIKVIEPKRTEEEWLEIQKRVNQSFQFPSKGVIIYEKIKILEANQTLATMFGYTLSEIIDMTVLELTTLEVRGIILRNILLKNKRPYQAVGLKKDGAIFPIEIHSSAFRYQGRIVRAMTVREITDDKQALALETLQKTKTELEKKVQESTTELRFTNERLRLELNYRERIEMELKVRARQQAAVVELGQRALVGTNLPTLMNKTVIIVAQTLNVEYSQILELLPDNNALLLRAGVGWWEGLVGQTMAEANTDSQAGYTLLSGEPVIVEDFDQETRFTQSPLFQEYGVISGITITIQGQNQPFGVLGVHTAKRRTFTGDDIYFLQAVANMLTMAIKRKQTESQILHQNRKLLTLQSASTAIASSLDLQHILNTTTMAITSMLEATASAISEWNQEANTISLLARYRSDGQWGDDLPVIVSSLTDYPLKKQVLMNQCAEQVTISQLNIDLAELIYMQVTKIKTLLILPLVFQHRVVGLVEIMSRDEQLLTYQEISLAQLLVNQAASAIENARLYQQAQQEIAERKWAEEQSKASLKGKEVLLKEIHHRVKNNLQVISSLLDLQTNSIQDPQILDIFRQSTDRIKTMSLIHEQLYQAEDVTRIDFAEYIRKLVANLRLSYRINVQTITLMINTVDISLGIDKAIPCGLIINELVSNSFKHAFPVRTKQPAEIYIDIQANCDNQYTLRVRDNGIGFPPDVDFRRTKSLGMRLVTTLVKQLKGTIVLHLNKGTEFKISFTKENKR